MSVETILTPAQRDDLQVVAAMIIPASSEYNVPGADDAAIRADRLATLGRDAAMVREALDHLARLAGMPLANLDAARRDAVAAQFRASGGPAAATLVRVVLQCYYRDDRVLRSLGLELRPPFPKGYELEQGDWSLLDPVKARFRRRCGERAKGSDSRHIVDVAKSTPMARGGYSQRPFGTIVIRCWSSIVGIGYYRDEDQHSCIDRVSRDICDRLLWCRAVWR